MIVKYGCIVLLFSLFAQKLYSQEKIVLADKYQQSADSLNNIQEYHRAAQTYLMEEKLRTMIPFKKSALVNAAFNYAQAKMPDSALFYFTAAATDGFSNLSWLNTDPALSEMRNLSGYNKLQKYLSKTEDMQHDPETAKLTTSDIDLFWKVYDEYKKDSSDAAARFITQYFEKGSLALQEYYRIKTPNIGGIRGFVHNMATMPEFYQSIRQNTLRTDELKDSFRIIFRNLKNWYPQSIFPNTTFLIGGWSSGGTSTDYGAIVGVDMFSADNKTKTSELNLWQKNNLKFFDGMKYVVAHELIHIQQTNMADDTTLLSYAIKEGMADFLGELISGKNANIRLHTWALGKEYQVWMDFKKEMFLNRYSNWIANSKQETPDHPADLGYWVGYQICKAYFDQAKNKKQAVYDMLHIRDYKKFLDESGIDKKMNLKKTG